MNGLLFHGTATYWGWHVMKNSTWLPWYMGGLNPKGDIYGSFQVLFIDTPPGTHCYILFTYGYHLLNFVNHFFKEKNNDWRTMLIHHIAAVALFPGLIFGGLLGAGVVAAWLHDVADIFVAICRTLNVLEFKWSSTFAFIAMISVWFYTRLMLLPYFIYICLAHWRFPDELSHFNPLIFIEVFFVSIMQVLHIFWFAMFMRMGYRMIVTGERKDIIHKTDDIANQTTTDSEKNKDN